MSKNSEARKLALKHIFEKRQKNLMRMVVRQIETDLQLNLDQAIRTGIIPESWMNETGDLRTVKSIIDSYFRERPFKPSDKIEQLEFDNIHLNI